MTDPSRRGFLGVSAGVATAGVASVAWAAKDPPSERVRVGVMGGGGRALSLINTFARNPAVELVATRISIQRAWLKVWPQRMRFKVARCGKNATFAQSLTMHPSMPSWWEHPIIGMRFQPFWPAKRRKMCTSKNLTGTTWSKECAWSPR